MSRAFEVEGGEIVTIHQDGRVRQSPIPKGFDKETFRNVLAAVDMLYRREGVFPTVEEVYKSWPKITKTTYSKAFASPEFKTALEFRGISMEENPGLTPEQNMAILSLSNWSDRASTETKMKRLGISMQKLHAWKRQPLFSQTLSQRAEQNLGDSVEIALNRLVEKADAGDLRAIEKTLEISGRYNPQNIEVANARQVVLVMVEAVLKHVSNPDEKKAILAEVEDSMSTGMILNHLNDRPKELS